MDVQHIISKALIDYDTVQPVIKYLLDNCVVPPTADRASDGSRRTKFTFNDKVTGDVVLETEIETFAIYYDKYKVWSWAWSHPGLYLVENSLARDILIHALSLEVDLSYIKSILTTSRGQLKDPIQIDINLAIGASFTKQPFIYPYKYQIEDSYLIYYTVLLNRPVLDKMAKKLIK